MKTLKLLLLMALVVLVTAGCRETSNPSPALSPKQVVAELVGKWIISHRRLPDGQPEVQYCIEFTSVGEGEGVIGELMVQVAPYEYRPMNTRTFTIINTVKDSEYLIRHEIYLRNNLPDSSSSTGIIRGEEIYWEINGSPSLPVDISQLRNGITKQICEYEYDIKQEIIWKKEN